MVAWNQSKAVLVVDWVCFLVAACFLLYLLVRHALLTSGNLRPHALGCGDCVSALIAALCCRNVANQSTHCSQTQAPKKEELSGANAKVVFYCTFGCLLSYLLYCVDYLFVYASKAMIGWLPFAYCQNGLPPRAPLYVAAKGCLYAVFVGRLYLGFKDSAFAYGKSLIRTLYAAVVFYALAVFTLTVVYVRGKHTVDGSHHYCQTVAPVFIFAFVLLFDLIFTSFVVFLFVSALNKLLKKSAQRLNEKEHEHYVNTHAEMHVLPLKYTVLSIVAITSTMVTLLLFVFTRLTFLLPFDCVVNCVALVLMTGQWLPVFTLVCSPLLKCVVFSPCLPCGDLTKVEAIEVLSQRENRGRSEASEK